MVKEREVGISPIQIHVSDKDTQGSPAWRVRYILHGEMSEFFQVVTNPETNDGILTLFKVRAVTLHFIHSKTVCRAASVSHSC